MFFFADSSWIVPNKNMLISPPRSFHPYQFLMPSSDFYHFHQTPQISHSSPCTRTILLTCTKPPSFCREKQGFDRAFSRGHVAGENRSIHHHNISIEPSILEKTHLSAIYVYIYIHIFVNLDYLPQQGNHLNRFPNIQNCHTVSSTWKDSPIFDQRSFGTGDEMSNITKTCNVSRESVVVRCPFWKRL